MGINNNQCSKKYNDEKSIAIMGIKGLPSKGGGERVAEAIINRLAKENYCVYVYGKQSYCDNALCAYKKNNVNLILIKDFKGKHLNAFLFGLFTAFHALIFGKYDLIHLHYADFGYIVPLLKLKYKVLGTSHGAEYNREKWGRFAKLFFKLSEIPFVKYSDLCTCVSKPLTQFYKNKYKKKVKYIPNGIVLEKFDLKNQAFLKKYNLRKNSYIIFCAGRIIPSKGCDLLLKAYKKIGTNIPLIIIGKIEEKSYDRYLKQLADFNVKFIDFVSSKKELYDYIVNSCFFVFPSIYEAMSMMLLEVASLKKGIVCSDIVENKEAIGDNALYFKNGSIMELSQKLQFAIDRPKLMSKVGEEAYHWVKENRNWDSITDIYIDTYKTFF